MRSLWKVYEHFKRQKPWSNILKYDCIIKYVIYHAWQVLKCNINEAKRNIYMNVSKGQRLPKDCLLWGRWYGWKHNTQRATWHSRHMYLDSRLGFLPLGPGSDEQFTQSWMGFCFTGFVGKGAGKWLPVTCLRGSAAAFGGWFRSSIPASFNSSLANVMMYCDSLSLDVGFENL